jgi:uncharacterized protein YlbG (UPF0298 family)
MVENITEKLDKPESLPALPTGYVRVVHRLVYGDGKNLESIKQNGLIFNREAAHCPKDMRGGSYNNITSMASVYDEDLFWNSMKKDDFDCYNDARFADVKVVFDLPKREFAFLQKFGRVVYGRIDAKYLVGCVPNYNGANKNLRLPLSEVEKAGKISQQKFKEKVEPNNIEQMMSPYIEAGKYSLEKLNKKIAETCAELDGEFAGMHRAVANKIRQMKETKLVLR